MGQKIVDKRVFFVILLVSMAAISGCVTATGNPELNDRARDLRLSSDFEDDLQTTDRQLQACIIYSFLLQEERGLEPRESIIRFACEAQETNYRAAVMSGVRDEWQSQASVLNNTANTATDNVYQTTIKSLER